MDPVRRPLLTLLLVAGIARAAALWIGWDSLSDDPDAYTAISQTLAKTGVFGLTGADGRAWPTAFRPPLYPAILAAFSLAIIAVNGVLEDPVAAENSPWFRGGVALLHWGLALVTAAATYLAARRLLRQSDRWADDARIDWAAWFAAMLVVFDPILLQSSTRVMTETLATALAALALLSWALLVERLSHRSLESERTLPVQPQRRFLFVAVTLGFLLGLAYLCRPTFIVWTVLLAGYLATWSLRTGRWRPGIAALPPLLITAIFVGGWMLRNQRHFGHPIWATTHGGYTLLLGNNPSFYRYLRTGQIGIAWDPEAFFQRWEARVHADPRRPDFWDAAAEIAPDPRWQDQRPAAGDEVAQDRLAYETAVQAIKHDPSGFVRACLWRVGRLISPLPQRSGGPPGPGIVAVTALYCGILVLVVLGGLQLGRRLLRPPWAAALTLVLALVVVHAFYWTNMRMRAPAIPVLGIVAAAAWLRTPPSARSPGCIQPADRR